MSKHLLYRKDLLNRTLTRSLRLVLPQLVACLLVLFQAISPVEAAGPLSVKTTNPRFFDSNGKSVYLTGSYLNEYNTLSGSWDFASYLDFLQQQKQNFTRVWGWEQSPWIYDKTGQVTFSTQPYERTGPGLALDGGLKFDLTRFNPVYFDQLRSRVVEAAHRGIYVSVMLFEGFSTQKKAGRVNPWLSDPFQQVNNINGINGDPNRNGAGEEFFSLNFPSVLALQEAFARKVVDTLNDLDNVLYEVSGNDLVGSLPWQYHMIDYIKNYQATKRNQHPVGISQFAAEKTAGVMKSSVDWIVIQETNSPLPTGAKVLIMEGSPASSGEQVPSTSPISLVQLLPDSVVSSQSAGTSNNGPSSNGVTLLSSSTTSSTLTTTKSSSNQQSQVATPTITPNGGVYSGTVAVTLQTTTAGASIYYTTDGQSPTQSSRRYTGKFTLSDSTLVKAKAFKSNLDQSAEASAWFANAASPAVAASGLVAYWKFDEGSGTTVADSSGNGNTGTLVNGPMWTAGRVGNALFFDGIDDNVTVPDSNSLDLSSSFTLSAWVNPAATFTDFRSILVKNYKYYLYASVAGYCGDGRPLAGFSDATAKTVCQPSPLPINTWTHLALTYNSSTLTLYQNGVAVATSNASGTLSPTTGTLQIGASQFGEYFKGLIDEVRIYNKALSATEIQTIYQQDSAITVQTVATPVISPSGGNYSGSVPITMQTATSGASIYYTTNGSTPTTSSTLYTGAVTLTSSATVKAKAFKSGSSASAEASAAFTVTQPFSFSLANSGDKSVVAGSSVTNSIAATLVSGSSQAVSFAVSGLPSGATGSFSSTSCSPSCSPTLTINTSNSTAAGSSTITVTATVGGVTKTTTFSLAVSLPTVAAPAISPTGGSYTGSVSVTMQTATPGASIYYTTNGSSPTQSSTLYTGAMTLTSSAVVKAKAFKTGYNSSAEASASYTVSQPFSFSLSNSGDQSVVAGSSVTNSISTTLTSGNAQAVSFSVSGLLSGATASFSSNSCSPACSSHLTINTTSSTPAGGSTITVTATGGGVTKTTTFSLNVSLPTVAMPTISPSGGSFTGSVSVTMQTATSGASIYYTTNGSTPTQSSTLYTGTISLTSSATVKAKAFKSGYISSAESSASFTVAAPLITAWTFCAFEYSLCNFSGTKEVRYGTNGVYVSQIFTNGVACDNNVFGDPVYGWGKQCEYRDVSNPLTVATSTISPNGGSYTGSASVAMQTATSGASIYYTTDGSSPTPLSTLYTGAITLTNSATVKAKAFKSGYISSAESSASFTVAAPLITAWTFCAVENSSCNFSGTKEVRYGTNGVYVSQVFTNGVSCENNVFGDPVYGYVKQCEYRDVSNPLTVATPAISPNGGSYSGSVSVTMQTATSGASIYYTTDGSSPTPLSTLYTGAINLTSSSLVKAKAFKSGYISSAESSASFTVAALPITAWTFCATEKSPCNFSGTKEVRYGTSGVYVSNVFTNGVSCENNVFGDPVYGYVKQCEYRDVSPSFDFALSHSGNKSGIAGSSVANSVSATLVSGSGQPVSFSTSGLPSGATGFFSSPSCNPTCSTVLTVNTTGSTPAGNFPITITSTGGSVTRTTVFTLSITLALNVATSTISPASGTGNTYYVATDGSDSNSGNFDRPFRTIKQGLSALRGGDTLFIRGGTYNENVTIHESVVPNIAGTVNARTWIGAYNNENVIIVAPRGGPPLQIYSSDGRIRYITVDGLKLDSNCIGCTDAQRALTVSGEGGCPTCTGASFIRIQNVEAYHAADCAAGVFVGAANNEFINVKSHDNGLNSCNGIPGFGAHGFYVAAGNNLFDGVEAYNNAQYGMQLYNGDGAPNNITVRNSYFHNNSGLRNGGGFVAYGNNHVIYNNIFANDPRSGAAIGSAGYNVLFYNNTTYGNAIDGLQINGGGTGHIVKNNIVYGNAGQITVTQWATNITFSNNLCGSPGLGCDLVANPLFVDAANGNFDLQSTSPAIGASTSYITANITSSSTDIGAY